MKRVSGLKISGDNFTIILQAASMHADSKSAKRQWRPNCIFVLLGSGCEKASYIHVGKIDPWNLTRII